MHFLLNKYLLRAYLSVQYSAGSGDLKKKVEYREISTSGTHILIKKAETLGCLACLMADYVTLGLRVMSLNPTLGIEST